MAATTTKSRTRKPAAAAARKPAAAPASPRRAWRRDREGKELALIRAFDRVLQREGVHAIGVNAVVKESGYGKNLLYKYFGGLAGLARAWAGSHDFLPPPEEIVGRDLEQYARLGTAEQIVNNYLSYAKALRRRPRTLHILANELIHPTELTQALEEVRAGLGRGLQGYFTREEEYLSPGGVSLLVLLYASMSYLAMRSSSAPRYHGLRLDNDDDWAVIEEMVRIVVTRVMAAEGGDKPSPTLKAYASRTRIMAEKQRDATASARESAASARAAAAERGKGKAKA